MGRQAITPKSYWLLALLVAAAAVILLLEEFVGAQEDQVRFARGGLATSNRSRLSICVDGARGAAVAAAEVEAISRGLDDLFAAGRYSLVYGGEHLVVVGCPPPTALSAVPRSRDARHGSDGGGVYLYAPEGPSEHRVFVYVIPPDVYNASFGSEPFATGTAEFLCQGHECAAVTTSLYITPSVAANVLREGLLDALGLHGRVSDPPQDPTAVQQQREEALTPQPLAVPTPAP